MLRAKLDTSTSTSLFLPFPQPPHTHTPVRTNRCITFGTLARPCPFACSGRYSVIKNFELFSGVLRVKGCFWTAAEPSARIDYSVVGKTANLVIKHMWAQVGLDMLSGGLEEGQFKDHEAAIGRVVERLNSNVSRLKEQGVWHPVTHDRRVELVFIGDAQAMDAERIRAAIGHALLTEEELDAFMRAGESFEPAEEPGNPFADVPRCALSV